MTWCEKQQATPFDNLPIQGLFFLSSDNPNLHDKGIFFERQKKPMILFPSGLIYPIYEPEVPQYLAIIHLFDQLELPYNATRNEAYQLALEIAADMGYAVFALEEDMLAVHCVEEEQHLLVSYDNEAGHMLDVTRIPRLK